MVIPQVWLSPADSSAQSRSGATGWGRLRSSVSPTPSWPASFAPQQNVSCCLVTAQECSLPAVTCFHCVCPAIPEKCGISFRSSLVPSPTWPRLLRPQQARNPLDSNRAAGVVLAGDQHPERPGRLDHFGQQGVVAAGAELAVGVLPPADDVPVGGVGGAAVVGACGDVRPFEGCEAVIPPVGVVHLHRRRLIVSASVSELAVAAFTPAPDVAPP